jgi:type 1 glutamine amidotransferase
MAEPTPESGNHPLLTTAHTNSMKTLAWTRAFRGGRVFCWQAGHDHHAFGDPHFRRVLANAVRWLAGRDDEGDRATR